MYIQVFWAPGPACKAWPYKLIWGTVTWQQPCLLDMPLLNTLCWTGSRALHALCCRPLLHRELAASGGPAEWTFLCLGCCWQWSRASIL